MGSGKSVVGSRLSEVTSKPFIDLDTEIENETGLSIPELFKVKGEIFFRKKEQEVLRSLLKKETSFVLATGGGTPCYGTIMQEINETENVHSFFLNTSINVLTERLFKEREQRPLIAHIQTKELLQDFIRKHIFEIIIIRLKI